LHQCLVSLAKSFVGQRGEVIEQPTKNIENVQKKGKGYVDSWQDGWNQTQGPQQKRWSPVKDQQDKWQDWDNDWWKKPGGNRQDKQAGAAAKDPQKPDSQDVAAQKAAHGAQIIQAERRLSWGANT